MYRENTNFCSFSDDIGYTEKIKLVTEEIESLAPKANAETRFQEATEKLKGTDADVSDAMEVAKEAKNAFEKVRKARLEAFKNMFTNVSEKIDSVYKELTKRPNAPLGGSAFLALEDDENPFLGKFFEHLDEKTNHKTGGVKFECMPPNKRYRAMEQLSGGEKTIAALALLFAIHSFRPSPFFVLDEVDAALDNHNVERVSSYIQKRTSEGAFQCLVISLKDTFFCKAEALVGVYRDAEEDSSRCMTLDLSKYSF
jgi:structural maintenance of chromosome 1